jgi:hypothetical protein
MLCHVALVRTDVSEELGASFIRATRIGELGTTPPKRRFLQEPHGITFQKTPFFIVTAVKTSNLTYDHIDAESGIKVMIITIIYLQIKNFH